MRFTDLFIKRPVLACVLSLFILLLGLYSIFKLPLSQYPKTESTMITVSTNYTGASAALIQGFITTPLMRAVSQANGIDYMTTSSTQNSSVLTIYMTLNHNPNDALAQVLTQVNSVKNQLPEEADEPVITVSAAQQFDLMYLSFSSNVMTPEEITDYLTRVIQPKLVSIDGITKAEILGGQPFSMRIWLDPINMQKYDITPTQVTDALNQNNIQIAVGQTKGELVAYNVQANTDLHDMASFARMIVSNKNGTFIRLSDIARVELGSESYDSNVFFNHQQAVFIGIVATPEANPLDVSTAVHHLMPELQTSFPTGLESKVVYDSSTYIKESMHEVILTIAITAWIVVMIIFAFLGSFRTVIIPVITMPLSIIGVCFFMLLLGYSLNLLTLLAMVLAIGLVVDDAIVVVENIYRHLEEGKTSLEAALLGAREIASPIISMTMTLAAVYAPIGFMDGLTGELFTEFAFTLAGSVMISGIIALTLTPIMCSTILTPSIMNERFVKYVDHFFEKLRLSYQKRLTRILSARPVTLVFAIIILISCYGLAATTATELAPSEDQSSLWAVYTGPQYANIDYMTKFSEPINQIFQSIPESENYFMVNGIDGVNSGISGLLLKPWDQRKKSQEQIKNEIQPQLGSLAGVQSVVFSPPALPGNNGGLPVQFVITSTDDFPTLYAAQEQLKTAAQHSGLFAYVSGSLLYNNPQININIDRDRAADVGITMENIGDLLSLLVSGSSINRFSMQDMSYEVIPQVMQQYRYNPSDLGQYPIQTLSGKNILLSNIASITQTVQPNALTTFQQLNSATIDAMMIPGQTVMAGLNFLRTEANKIFPKNMTYDYAGESRQTIKEGNTLTLTFLFSLIVIYLVLAAKFESWSDPLVILISVPMSICGALIPLNLGFASLNIYSGIGLVTLIGLISKHGILMVEFANVLRREQKLALDDAIIQSASLRLRPILMTTFAMVFGVLPLLFANGAGSHSRCDMGLVIFSGMSIGTIFTLFVVPTMYTFLAKRKVNCIE
ncbi:MAG: efflux RND transporter permease subunit [Gammaproteobacteria bacterium]|nr:efflux RND transporter permease subunit [Gammaproteobacteria bacterium]MCD8542761.1 efflux RND transporter permease subunit [Gammaproteobacteria bacterium]